MAEKKYIECEEAVNLLRAEARRGATPYHIGIYAAARAVESIPAADVRPVVLCRDCRHRDPEDYKCDSGEMERQGCPFKVADNYFCAYGER